MRNWKRQCAISRPHPAYHFRQKEGGRKFPRYGQTQKRLAIASWIELSHKPLLCCCAKRVDRFMLMRSTTDCLRVASNSQAKILQSVSRFPSIETRASEKLLPEPST